MRISPQTCSIAWLILLISLVLVGCGDEGIFETDRSLPEGTEPADGLTALQFPTSNGLAWTYQEVESKTVHTLTVEGLSYERGRTLRQLTSSSLDAPTDFYAANAWYLRIDGYPFRAFGFPISATYFEKNSDAYEEVAFDAYLPGFDPPTLHQQHFPVRKLWEFPLNVGRTWTVFETAVPPIAVATRTVVAANQVVQTPAGIYEDVYVVEESFSAEGEIIENPIARHWIAPNVGVVKHQYSVVGGGEQTYELVSFVN